MTQTHLLKKNPRITMENTHMHTHALMHLNYSLWEQIKKGELYTLGWGTEL